MGNEAFLNATHDALMLIMVVSLPPLVAATLAGLLVSLLGAVTQIQDQTLPQVVKIIVVLLIVIFLGPALSVSLLREAEQILSDFPALTR